MSLHNTPAERGDYCTYCGTAPCRHPDTSQGVKYMGFTVETQAWMVFLILFMLGVIVSLLIWN